MKELTKKQKVFEIYCGAATTLDSCLRYGEFVAGSKEHKDMEQELQRLWNDYQRLTD